MPRPILDESRIHPAVRQTVATHHTEIVAQVEAAIGQHAVLVVGMAMNPMPKKARAALDAAGIAHGYLEFGSYFNTWRKRNALKMWSGWPTFPMVFVKGNLVGGASDLQALIASGDSDISPASATTSISVDSTCCDHKRARRSNCDVAAFTCVCAALSV